jgi:hypothetical protein
MNRPGDVPRPGVRPSIHEPRESRGPRLRREAERDLAIVALLAAGGSCALLAAVAGLCPRQVRRIGAAAPDPTPTPLTPLELRGLVREHRADGRALEWLAALRTDRRRNGRPYRAG